MSQHKRNVCVCHFHLLLCRLSSASAGLVGVVAVLVSVVSVLVRAFLCVGADTRAGGGCDGLGPSSSRRKVSSEDGGIEDRSHWLIRIDAIHQNDCLGPGNDVIPLFGRVCSRNDGSLYVPETLRTVSEL
jgi:hypothetical protein